MKDDPKFQNAARNFSTNFDVRGARYVSKLL